MDSSIQDIASTASYPQSITLHSVYPVLFWNQVQIDLARPQKNVIHLTQLNDFQGIKLRLLESGTPVDIFDVFDPEDTEVAVEFYDRGKNFFSLFYQDSAHDLLVAGSISDFIIPFRSVSAFTTRRKIELVIRFFNDYTSLRTFPITVDVFPSTPTYPIIVDGGNAGGGDAPAPHVQQ